MMTIQANKRRLFMLTAVAVLLMVPLVAMQFSSEVNWTTSDFLVAAVLLLGTGFLSEVVLTRVKSLSTRLILCGLVLFALFLIWAELAVGIFGTPFAGS